MNSRNKNNVLILFGCIVFLCMTAGEAFPSNERIDSLEAVAQRLEGLTGTLRTVPNLCPKVYVDVGGVHYYYVHQPSNLFPSRHEIDGVQIVSIGKRSTSPIEFGAKTNRMRYAGKSDDGGSYLSVRLNHPHLRRGEIRIFREDKQLPQNVDDLVQILGYALEAPGLPKQPLYVGNRQTKTLHFAGCNYLPAPQIRESFQTIQEAQDRGYVLSPLSFTVIPHLSSYNEERLLGARTAAEIRTYHPLSVDPSRQQRVETVGRKVLANWPTSHKGYPYHFYALESDSLNAFACPGGTVFVTTGLLDALESDDELEAVLAHEITHVERRHGLRELRSAQVGAAVGAIITLGAAAAAYDQNNSAAAAIGLSGLIVHVAANIALTGYSRQHEMEADTVAAMYLLHNRKDPVLLAAVLKKYKYYQDKLGIDANQSNLFSTHPALDDRIYIAEHSTIRPYDPPIVFDGYSKDGELVASIAFDAEFVYSDKSGDAANSLLTEITTTTALQTEAKIKDVRIQSNGRKLKLENKDDIPFRPLDAVNTTFEIRNKKVNRIPTIEEIELKLNPIIEWIKR